MNKQFFIGKDVDEACIIGAYFIKKTYIYRKNTEEKVSTWRKKLKS